MGSPRFEVYLVRANHYGVYFLFEVIKIRSFKARTKDESNCDLHTRHLLYRSGILSWSACEARDGHGLFFPLQSHWATAIRVLATAVSHGKKIRSVLGWSSNEESNATKMAGIESSLSSLGR